MNTPSSMALPTPVPVAGAARVIAGATVAMHPDHAPAGQTFADAKWSAAPPVVRPGAGMAVLDSDPTRPIMYAVGVRLSRSHAIPAHSHRTTDHAVVTSGAPRVGRGDAPGRKVPTNTVRRVGGFVKAEARGNPFASTPNAETTIVPYWPGPAEFNHLAPNDDPRNHQGGAIHG